MKAKEKEPRTLGERVKVLRDEYQLTQSDLASKVGVSILTIGNIERGVALNPYPDTIKSIAEALGSTYDWLMEGKGERFVNGKKVLNVSSPSGEPGKEEAWDLAREQLKKKDETIDRLTNAFDRLTEFMSRIDMSSFLHPVRKTGSY